MSSDSPSATSAAEAVSVLLCDDVRTEDNNKRIYIGVYSESVKFNAYPGFFIVRPVITVTSTERGSHPVYCRFSWPGYETAMEDGSMPQMAGDYIFEEPDVLIHVPLPPLAMNVTNTGRFVMECSKNGTDWYIAASLSMIVPDPPANS